MDILIRPMKLDDIPQIVELCNHFGFPASVEALTSRFKTILKFPSHIVFVAEEQSNSNVLGCLHAYEAPSLLSESTAEGGGLVIHKNFRRLGIGKALVNAAEEWARSKGIKNALLATRIDREDALIFYKKLGYKFVHTTHFLTKEF